MKPKHHRLILILLCMAMNSYAIGAAELDEGRQNGISHPINSQEMRIPVEALEARAKLAQSMIGSHPDFQSSLEALPQLLDYCRGEYAGLSLAIKEADTFFQEQAEVVGECRLKGVLFSQPIGCLEDRIATIIEFSQNAQSYARTIQKMCTAYEEGCRNLSNRLTYLGGKVFQALQGAIDTFPDSQCETFPLLKSAVDQVNAILGGKDDSIADKKECLLTLLGVCEVQKNEFTRLCSEETSAHNLCIESERQLEQLAAGQGNIASSTEKERSNFADKAAKNPGQYVRVLAPINSVAEAKCLEKAKEVAVLSGALDAHHRKYQGVLSSKKRSAEIYNETSNSIKKLIKEA